MNAFFTQDRREIISRTLFDTWKITVPAALAGGFFRQYDWTVRLSVGILIFIVFAMAVIVFPKRKSEGAL